MLHEGREELHFVKIPKWIWQFKISMAQTNLDLIDPIFPFLNRIMFDFRNM